MGPTDTELDEIESNAVHVEHDILSGWLVVDGQGGVIGTGYDSRSDANNTARWINESESDKTVGGRR